MHLDQRLTGIAASTRRIGNMWLASLARSGGESMDSWRSRITLEPGKRGGKPCIRGMRITVFDVMSYLAAGMTVEQVLDDFPYLTLDDIRACFAYAAERERSLTASSA